MKIIGGDKVENIEDLEFWGKERLEIVYSRFWGDLKDKQKYKENKNLCSRG